MQPIPTFARALLILTILVGGARSASAHAIIRSSVPTAGAVVSANTLAIRLRFNSRIDRARSRLTLIAPDGAEQTLETAESPPDALDAEAKPLSSGLWRLRWQVLNVDGHITRGEIPFTVR
jgi:methionine-rich copper-binding protein CopC